MCPKHFYLSPSSLSSSKCHLAQTRILIRIMMIIIMIKANTIPSILRLSCTPLKVSNISSPSSPVVSDPKPEWKPNQHQAQILEELFIGGTVNPSLTSIKQITIKLQSYGEEVDDADVYKWFHNRKYSRKPKLVSYFMFL
ncbi:Homeobox-like domain superfamily [Arabidopsis thaliana x Arabidopsis arenosa]|uniref:Homeobox-like domain superfamily n=1 Tax=Arabidopsis thaliana x Arabidopsis arenosa TaxID=1240361 RepID=A0A8T2CXV9_9BRAS|nr:Homeobox-like domain superfamily [Arabidopsis thaliana x Arabidopsis arenosa]